MQREPAIHANLTLRQAKSIDAPAVADLITQLGYPTSPDEMHTRLLPILNNPTYLTLLAVNGSRILGMAGACLGRFYEKNHTYGRLIVMVVDERVRNQGIGQYLLQAVETWLIRQGASEAIVNSHTYRPDAHRFYHVQGYQTTGVRLVKALKADIAQNPNLPIPESNRLCADRTKPLIKA
jgi:GNAT superfamily N-acetyltransferase